MTRADFLCRYLLLLIFMLAGGGQKPAAAAENLPLLNQIEQKINQSKQILTSKETAKTDLEKELALLDGQIAAIQGKLAAIKKQELQLEQEKKDLERQITLISAEVAKFKQKIADLINNQYRRQYPNALIIMLQDGDLNTKTRNLAYVKYLQRQQKKIYLQYTVKNQELSGLYQELEGKSAGLRALSAAERQHLAVIKNKQIQQMQLKKAVEAGINAAKTNLQALQHAEIQLNEKIRAAARAGGNLTASDLRLTDSGQAKIVDSSEPLGVSAFLAYKGQLNLPVWGKVSAAYGEKREDGSIVKGLVIEAVSGSQVQSIAPGVVMYVGEISNFGKTVIIRHDQDYSSIYTGLGTITVQRGQEINKNYPIGKSGILYNGKPGIYFELREHSRAINPKTWFRY